YPRTVHVSRVVCRCRYFDGFLPGQDVRRFLQLLEKAHQPESSARRAGQGFYRAVFGADGVFGALRPGICAALRRRSPGQSWLNRATKPPEWCCTNQISKGEEGEMPC